jgi:hypothetical protein
MADAGKPRIVWQSVEALAWLHALVAEHLGSRHKLVPKRFCQASGINRNRQKTRVRLAWPTNQGQMIDVNFA